MDREMVSNLLKQKGDGCTLFDIILLVLDGWMDDNIIIILFLTGNFLQLKFFYKSC